MYVFLMLNTIHVTILVVCKVMLNISQSGCPSIIDHGERKDDGHEPE